MSRWSHWHVYEYMRQRLMHTGMAPDKQELLTEFADMEPSEIDEGVTEFEIAMGKRKRGGTSYVSDCVVRQEDGRTANMG